MLVDAILFDSKDFEVGSTGKLDRHFGNLIPVQDQLVRRQRCTPSRKRGELVSREVEHPQLRKLADLVGKGSYVIVCKVEGFQVAHGRDARWDGQEPVACQRERVELLSIC